MGKAICEFAFAACHKIQKDKEEGKNSSEVAFALPGSKHGLYGFFFSRKKDFSHAKIYLLHR